MTAGDNQTTGTDVGGIISTDTTWTMAGSPYNLIADVQIDIPATLTIEPGVVVHGNGLAIQTWGTLHAVGTQDDYIQFIQTNIVPGTNGSSATPFLIEIRYVDLHCGSIYGGTGNAIYGSLTLTDSHLWTPQFICIYGIQCQILFIERNSFYLGNNIAGQIIDGGINNGRKIYIRNNVFFATNSSDETEGLIANWAAMKRPK